MRRPVSIRAGARTFVLAIGLVVIAGCGTPAPVVRPGERPAEMPTSARPEGRAVPAAGTVSPKVYEEFRGRFRARAKTEYAMVEGALAPLEEFADLNAVQTFLQPRLDPTMRARYPHISAAETEASARVTEELVNVSVIAYIHAVKHEHGPPGDNDFHVMLGSSPTSGDGFFLTAEASALPAYGDNRELLADARQRLLSIIGECRCDGRFMQVLPPIKVRVVGSLFFDAAHGIASVGPRYAKPFTVWEIHPILSIERLD